MFTRNFKRSINYLASQQQKDGSFLSLSSTDSEDFTKHRLYHSSFPAALICLALNSLKQPVVEKIQQKAIKFLLSQKSKHWTFNYWVRNSQEAKKALKNCVVIVDDYLLSKLVEKYEQSARKVLLERQDALKFLKTYQSSAI